MKGAPSRSIVTLLAGTSTAVCGITLLLACVVFAIYDRTTARDALVRSLSIQAQIVASNSVSALTFDDPEAAGMTLAGLSAASGIVSAAIFTPDGQVFARYMRAAGASVPDMPAVAEGQVEGHRFEADRIVLARRIVFQGRQAGTVAIASDFRELIGRRNQYAGLLAAVAVASLMAAWILSRFAQRTVTRPLVHLAEVARRVWQEKDYAIRAHAGAMTAELTTLEDAFNEMLTEIQARDRSLTEARDGLEERVRERTVELDSANRELEAFTYSVSHDLRAPLRHVTGFVALLEEDAADRLNEQCREHLQKIAGASRRMGQLIDDLLSFSRVGRAQLTARRVSLNAIVHDARLDAAPLEEGRDVEWRVEDLPSVDVDPAMLRQVFVNLLSNALKYTRVREHPRIDVSVSRDEDTGELVICVRDNGVGFDMQYVHKLFGVFQRLHSSDEFEGTGIGLANVKRIVQRHGGRVWAESAVGHGAKFCFSLPAGGLRT
jgi:signal transduction histidine kinase